MIQIATEEMLPALRRIWQICFNDSADETELVFRHLLTPRHILTHTEEGSPVAMLNWMPLRFTSAGDSFAGAYLFGVATLPAYRSRGISRALMRRLHELLRQKGAAFSCLVPAGADLFEFYASQGFETVFRYRALTVPAANIRDTQKTGAVGVLSPALLDDLADLRCRTFARSALFGAWDKLWLRYTDIECRFHGGQVLRFSCGGRMGYVVCYPIGDMLLVKEAAVERQDLDTLLCELHRRFGLARYELRLPADFPPCPHCSSGDSGGLLPFAMGKWYDNEQKTLAGAAAATGAAPWFAFGLD